MRAPIAYLRARVAPVPTVPRMSPEDYAGRIFPLPGGGGTVTVLEDGSGTVHDPQGRAVTTLPAHTVAELVTEGGLDTET